MTNETLASYLRGISPSAAVFADQTLHNIPPYPYLSIQDTQKTLLVKGSLVMVLVLNQHKCFESLHDSLHDNVADHKPVITTLTTNLLKTSKAVFQRQSLTLNDVLIRMN